MNIETQIIVFLIFALIYFLERSLEIKLYKKVQGNIRENKSYEWMKFFHLFNFFAAVTEFLLIRRHLDLLVTSIGLILFIGSYILRKWTIKTLGKFWTVRVVTSPNQPLIKNGPYRFCRHPNYLAIILECVGFCLVANAYITLLITSLGYGIILGHRIKLEENFMIRKYGDGYKNYIKHVDAVVPSYKILRKIQKSILKKNR